MILQTIRLYNDKVAFPARYRFLNKKLSPYLTDSSKVLDVGSSNGKLAATLIKQNPKLDIIGVDTHVLSQKFIHIDKYDGRHLPYEKEAFDTSLLIDVLHHDKQIETILREVMRVTSKYILIKDHYYNNSVQNAILKWSDYLGNAPYGIELPFNYLTPNEWYALFKKLNLQIIKQETFFYSHIDRTNNIIFLLKK